MAVSLTKYRSNLLLVRHMTLPISRQAVLGRARIRPCGVCCRCCACWCDVLRRHTAAHVMLGACMRFIVFCNTLLLLEQDSVQTSGWAY
jgi:hypothetical protein